MKNFTFVFLIAGCCGAIGCSSLDSMGRNMDIASEHVSPEKPIYQGTLRSFRRVGALYALDFVDGQSFEVVECPALLVPGDEVRIYKHDKGFIAHLWKAAELQIPPGVIRSTDTSKAPHL